MVDVRLDTTGLQSRLQAQLEASRSTRIAGKGTAAITQPPKDPVEDRQNARESDSDANRRLRTAKASNSTALSTTAELEAAGDRINQLAGNVREAPNGRTSTRQSVARNQPLGQIVDIRV